MYARSNSPGPDAPDAGRIEQKPEMPDFDTRKTPQEPPEPNRLRFPLMANKLRALLIGGGILLFVVVAVPAGLLIYASSGLAAETVTCDQWMLGKTGTCYAPEEGDTVEVCKADSRDEVDDETPCRQPYDPLFCTDGSCYDTMETCRGYQEAGSGSRCRPPNVLFQLLGEIIWVTWKALP